MWSIWALRVILSFVAHFIIDVATHDNDGLVQLIIELSVLYGIWKVTKARPSSRNMGAILDIIDDGDDVVYSDTVVGDSITENRDGVQFGARRGKKQMSHYVGHLVRFGKARFGLPSRSEANLLVVRDYLRQEMNNSNVRVCDQARILAMATNLVFVPTKFEIEAARVFNDDDVLDRFNDMNKPMTGVSWLWSCFGFERSIKFTK